MVMGDEIAVEVARDVPDVTWDKMPMDAMAVRMVRNPQRLDPIAATNRHADILPGLSGAAAGTLGVAPTGTIDPERRYRAMVKPIHRFDISCRGIANPAATFRTAAQMPEHRGEGDAAKGLMTALEQVRSDGVPTPDMGGVATTRQATHAVGGADIP